MSEKKRKKAGDLTTEGLAKRLFPPEVIREVKREAREKTRKSRKKSATKKKVGD